MIKKYFIADNNSVYTRAFKEYKEYERKLIRLFLEFAEENLIESSQVHPNPERLYFKPTMSDIHRFSDEFVAGKNGYFKLKSKTNQKWVALCKANGIEDYKNYPDAAYYTYFSREAKYAEIPDNFITSDGIYFSLECDGEFQPMDDIKELNEEEFNNKVNSLS